MTDDLAALQAAIQELTTLTLSVARQSGYLPDDELVEAYRENARLTRVGFDPKFQLTPAQERAAEAIHAARRRDAIERKSAELAAAEADLAGQVGEHLLTLAYSRMGKAKADLAALRQLNGSAANIRLAEARVAEAEELVKLEPEQLQQKWQSHANGWDVRLDTKHGPVWSDMLRAADVEVAGARGQVNALRRELVAMNSASDVPDAAPAGEDAPAGAEASTS